MLSAPLFRRLQHLPPIFYCIDRCRQLSTVNTLPFAGALLQHSSIRNKEPDYNMGLGKKWNSAEIEAVCRAYVTATNNPIKGNQQKWSVFWDSVKDEFAKECTDGQRELASI